jgi:cellulose synthase/poly-beta-1,6-N-acetylglucosamine synthase-like glycosyltransferase
MDTLFSILSSILLIQSILALVATLRFTHYSLRKRAARQNRYQPKAVVIVPCKGLDHDFDENLRAVLAQDYRDYEVIFVTESENDPAHGALSRLIKQNRRAAWMVVAGEAQGQGQKVHNLCAAIEMLNSIDRRTEVLVFADSDARPARNWLAELIAPLGDKRVGATTGFRWYEPSINKHDPAGSSASILLSAWNSSALALLGERSSFAWGGSMAIRRENFERLGVKKLWQGSVSDDYVLTSAIREMGQRIKFVPPCLVASHAGATFQSLLEFTTRQMRITRVYAPRVWKLACVAHSFYNFTFWGGLAWYFASSFLFGNPNYTLAASLAGVYLLGAITGALRAMVATRLLPGGGESGHKLWWAYALSGPIVSLIYLYNVIVAAWTKRIVWRGIGYDLISPSETVILHRPAQRSSTEKTARASKRRPSSVRSSSQKR